MADTWLKYNYPFYFQGDAIVSFDVKTNLSQYNDQQMFFVIFPTNGETNPNNFMDLSTQINSGYNQSKLTYVDFFPFIDQLSQNFMRYEISIKCTGDTEVYLGDNQIQRESLSTDNLNQYAVGILFRNFDETLVKNLQFYLPN